ncbi:AAA family ATPase [Paenibacillus arenosi]|uniref:AAA family ATPase n=1 Tax=Paenibacillus arenosi TaxID=2774142 RepID=A0ABR9AXC5_9BACL|nr:AAA family ATPase [Paenibacillus arenosi]
MSSSIVPFESFRKEIDNLIAQFQYNAALSRFEELKDAYHSYADMYDLYANVLQHNQAGLQAVEAAQQAVRMNKGCIDYQITLGRCYEQIHYVSEATQIYEQVVSQHTMHRDALLGLCRISFATGEYNKGVDYAQLVCSMHPEDAEAWQLYGKCLLKANAASDLLLSCLHTALSLASHEELEFELLKALYEAGQYEECQVKCTRMLRKYPNSSYTNEVRHLLIRLKNNPQRTQQSAPILNSPLQIHFEEIKQTLQHKLYDQKSYSEKLCQAFMRPFMMRRSDTQLKNAIVISGQEGTGRHYSLQLLSQEMVRKGYLQEEGYHEMDLSLYATPDQIDSTFLSDLYAALNGHPSIIVFKNIEKCHSIAVHYISQLIIDHRLQLAKRYLFDQKTTSLLQISGNLTVATVDDLYPNGKYFVFVSEKEPSTVLSYFPNEAALKIMDMLATKPLSDESLEKITKKYLKKYISQHTGHVRVLMPSDSTIPQLIVARHSKKRGAHGIKSYIEQHIYEPFLELMVKGQLEKEVVLDLNANEQFVLKMGAFIHVLAAKDNLDSSSALKEIQTEWKQMIGLDSVKAIIQELEDHLRIQKLRIEQGMIVKKQTLHMVFTGNPGTGKTTVARLVAKYLKASGFLSSGHLIECSRNDLVGQYLGHTAKQTNDLIQAAKGGILFIDEAYALARDKNDSFGMEAVNTLVKGMEDYREDLVVLFAGYKNEMEQFLKSNPGLQSRINLNVDFPDYTPQELYEIACTIAKGHGYSVAEACREPLTERFSDLQIPGKNDSGNGRLARNIIEQAIKRQSQRLLRELTTVRQHSALQMSQLLIEDFELDQKQEVDIEQVLAEVVGLENVKNVVRQLERQLIANEKRKQAGYPVQTSQSLNMIFTGNPGTGKTTVARIVSQLLQQMGVLSSDKIVEVDRSHLVAEYVGQTAVKTTDVFMSALGGVLFIDEAYALASDGGSFGQEAIDTLVKLIEEHRHHIVVILAGYALEMKDFLKSNSGLSSRFPLHLHFDDYSMEELTEIAVRIVHQKGFQITPDALKALTVQLRSESRIRGTNAGNGRLARNLIEQAIRKQSDRVSRMETYEKEALIIIEQIDVEPEQRLDKPAFNLDEQLQRIIGLDQVKQFMRSIQAELGIRKLRKEMGLPSYDQATLHMIFKGNPGTGKTMMARVVGAIMHDLGILRTSKLVETDRAGLVAGYVGQTALKTQEKIEEAMDGVLFIDEAYSLANDADSGSGFGKEAIDTLVKMMDDHRDRLIVILAGYSEEMDSFLAINPGLRSRFPHIIEFEDYSAAHLMIIAETMFTERGYVLQESAKQKMALIFENVQYDPTSGNGRYVRNLCEKAVRLQSMRLFNNSTLTKEELINITAVDIQAL